MHVFVLDEVSNLFICLLLDSQSWLYPPNSLSLAAHGRQPARQHPNPPVDVASEMGSSEQRVWEGFSVLDHQSVASGPSPTAPPRDTR